MLDGPRLPPAAGGKPDSLAVFLHGYGADGNDLIEIGRVWSSVLPHTEFVAPHAPQAMSGSPMGRQWFPLTLADPTEYWHGVTAAQPELDAFLDAELARSGFGDDRLALIGFSQGTMMALHAGPRRQSAPAAIVGFSGLLAGPEHLGGTKARPPVLLLHGDRDDLIPDIACEMAARALGAAGFLVEWHISQGLGHGIDQAGLHCGVTFLARALAAKAA